MSPSRYRILLAAILILSGALRFISIDRMSLWGDEACMMFLCRESAPDIVQALSSSDRPDVDVAPPLYFIMLHDWMAMLGTTVFSFRSFSAVFGILLVIAAVRLAVLLFDEKVALIAGFLLAINPFQIWYSQEGRMYTLAAFLAVMVILWFGKTIEKPGEISRWIIFGIMALLLLYTQYYGFLLIASLSAYLITLLVRKDAKNKTALLRGFIITAVAMFAAYLPWFRTVIADYRHAGAPGGFPDFFDPVVTPAFLLLKLTVYGNENYVRDHLWLYPLPLLVFAALLIRGILRFRERGVQIAAFCFAVPFLIVYSGSLSGLRIYKSHPFILFQVPLMLIAARGLVRFKPKLQIPAFIILAACSGYVCGTTVLAGDYVKPRVKDVVSWLETRVKPPDQVAVLPAFLPNPLPIVGDLLAFKYHSGGKFSTEYLTGSTAFEIVTNTMQPYHAGKLYFVYQDNPQIHDQEESIRARLAQLCHSEESQIFPSKIRDFTMGVDVFSQRN
jgi:uncharacterized membrane protein